MDFKKKYSLEQRKLQSKNIMLKYSDRLPILIHKSYNSRLIDVSKNKYLSPKDLTLGQFLIVMRSRIKLEPDKSIFLFINNKIFPNSALMNDIYNEEKDEDGFLYIVYSEESTFG